jgi:hypothetical protein
MGIWQTGPPSKGGRKETAYAFHKDLYIIGSKSGHWFFGLLSAAEGGGSQTRASDKGFGSTKGGA